MKWYSVKKYRPYRNGYCLVRTDEGYIYCAEWKNGDSGYDDDLSGWMIRTLCEGIAEGVPAFVEIGNVTHFLIPEPVEIEY